MGILKRIKASLRYLRNPGGTTRKARLSRAEQAAIKRRTTERLRAEVAQRELYEAVARAVGL